MFLNFMAHLETLGLC
uniref:Uncharacterized protein n=1 Tax=Rhizophora mucronata TaxID=61149 RepID=A0A2P2QM25_RHIMU